MCIHVNIARGKQHGDPRKIQALPRKSAHGDAPNESRAHTGSSRVMWAGPGQVVIRKGVYIIPSTSYPCVSISHHLHHTVYITLSTSYLWLSRPDPSQCLWRCCERVTSRVKERLGTQLDV